MFTRVSHITLIVKDQDQAVAFYEAAFGAEIRGDNEFEFEGEAQRWVTVGIPGDALEIVLSPPMTGPDGRKPAIGDNNMTVIAVTDVAAACQRVENAGGHIVAPPEQLPWGESAIIRDPDGNPWNLVNAERTAQA